MRIVTEPEFAERLRLALAGVKAGSVTGPGRSGAIAAVYASHILHVPFIPYKHRAPIELGRLLIIDTASETGATLRKAARFYGAHLPMVIAVYQEPPRVAFWYEAMKPQHYQHESRAA